MLELTWEQFVNTTLFWRLRSIVLNAMAAFFLQIFPVINNFEGYEFPCFFLTTPTIYRETWEFPSILPPKNVGFGSIVLSLLSCRRGISDTFGTPYEAGL